MSAFRFSPRPNRADRIRWREWGSSAFEEAARQDRPIALFVTAFWCGVCQRLEETQRPDVDLRYTRDGWPTIAFLSPSGEPILSVNALEPEPFISLLVKLVDAQDRGTLASSSPEPRPAFAADPS